MDPRDLHALLLRPWGRGGCHSPHPLELATGPWAYLIAVGSLRQNPQHRPSSVVEIKSSSQLTPQSTAACLGHISQLQNGHSDEAIIAREAVIFGADLQLKTVQIGLLVADYTASHTINPSSSLLLLIYSELRTQYTNIKKRNVKNE